MEQLYIAVGAAGLLKIGRTCSFEKRLQSLRAEFKRKGDTVLRHHAFEAVMNGYAVEAAMLRWARDNGGSVHSGREWFTGVDFDAAVVRGTAIREAWKNDKPWAYDWTPEQHAAWKRECELRAQESERVRVANIKWRADQERERQFRRLLKAHGERSFGVIVDVLRAQPAAAGA